MKNYPACKEKHPFWKGKLTINVNLVEMLNGSSHQGLNYVVRSKQSRTVSLDKITPQRQKYIILLGDYLNAPPAHKDHHLNKLGRAQGHWLLNIIIKY